MRINEHKNTPTHEPASLFHHATGPAALAQVSKGHVDKPLDQLTEPRLLLEGVLRPPQQLEEHEEDRCPLRRRAGGVKEYTVPHNLHLSLGFGGRAGWSQPHECLTKKLSGCSDTLDETLSVHVCNCVEYTFPALRRSCSAPWDSIRIIHPD